MVYVFAGIIFFFCSPVLRTIAAVDPGYFKYFLTAHRALFQILPRTPHSAPGQRFSGLCSAAAAQLKPSLGKFQRSFVFHDFDFSEIAIFLLFSSIFPALDFIYFRSHATQSSGADSFLSSCNVFLPRSFFLCFCLSVCLSPTVLRCFKAAFSFRRSFAGGLPPLPPSKTRYGTQTTWYASNVVPFLVF